MMSTRLACHAGKDAYVEKPPSHNIWEGRKMVEAARKYERVAQAGTQNRSAPYNLKAREYVESGGPLKLGPNGKPPKGFGWKAWLGPASYRPCNTRIFHGGWQALTSDGKVVAQEFGKAPKQCAPTERTNNCGINLPATLAKRFR